MNKDNNLQYTTYDFAYNCLLYQALDLLEDASVLNNRQLLGFFNSLICLYDKYEDLSDNTKSLLKQVFEALDKAGLYDRVGL